jgi:arylsulfatase A-like enzyme
MMQPNLVFIFTDQQRFDTMAAYGNHRIQTPHLDQLAAQSTVFDQAYVTQPICTPSRSSIMTGLYPHATGCTANNLPLPASLPTLAEWLDDSDYITAYHGKWHLGDEIYRQHGFDQWVSIEDNYARTYGPERDPTDRSSYHHFLLAHGHRPADGQRFSRAEAARMPEPLTKAGFLGHTASAFIREHYGQPFVLYVNFLEPHAPYFGPRDAQHDPDEVCLPSNFDAWPTSRQPLKTRMFAAGYREQGKSGLPLRTVADWRRMIANYWGLISLVDAAVGNILAALDETGARDRTIVVFTSDHGDMMGSHRLLTKFVMFQEAIRVPLLIQLPGQSAGRRVFGPVSQVDLVPTLLDLLDQAVPDGLHGQSRAELLRSDGTRLAEDVVIEWNGADQDFRADLAGEPLPTWMQAVGSRQAIAASVADPVRTLITPEGWAFTYSLLGEHQLYNLGHDSGETQNLALEPGHEPLIRRLTRRLRTWAERTSDPVLG